jgi:hypothetical protein
MKVRKEKKAPTRKDVPVAATGAVVSPAAIETL